MSEEPSVSTLEAATADSRLTGAFRSGEGLVTDVRGHGLLGSFGGALQNRELIDGEVDGSHLDARVVAGWSAGSRGICGSAGPLDVMGRKLTRNGGALSVYSSLPSRMPLKFHASDVRPPRLALRVTLPAPIGVSGHSHIEEPMVGIKESVDRMGRFDRHSGLRLKKCTDDASVPATFGSRISGMVTPRKAAPEEDRFRAILAADPYYGELDEWAPLAYDKIPVLPRMVMLHIYGQHDDTGQPYAHCALCTFFRVAAGDE